MKKVFLICPVREIDVAVEQSISDYVRDLEREGYSVYYPKRDTDQTDENGFYIITENKVGLSEADEVHIWFDRNSIGSVFDLGMAWATGKKLIIANPEDVASTNHKSFANVILKWSNQD